MVAQNITFYVLTAVVLVAGLRLVTTKNVIHAALYLVLVLGGVSGHYLLLAAEFVAVTQLLVYVGAIVVLILFGTMLTKAKIGRDVELTHNYWYVGAITAAGLFGLLAWTLIDAFEDTPLPADPRIGASNTAAVSDSIFGQYLVPFEAISVLLLAALIGAIVIARKD